MRRLVVFALCAVLMAGEGFAQDPAKPKEPSTEQKQQIVIAFQSARIAALEAQVAALTATVKK